MATFTKKTVYQSELVGATAQGPLTIILISHPKPSKYAGKPAYLPFKVAGEEGEFQLNIENATIEALLETLPINMPLQIQAFGSRDDAYISVVGNGSRAPAPQQHAPPQQQHTPPAHPDTRPQSIAGDYWEALDVAAEIAATFQKKHGRPPTREECTIAAALYIERNRNGGTRPLRAG